ncbi:MarR family winged helix-turn-helix transcriptional regulator [Sinomonas sp. RB5]
MAEELNGEVFHLMRRLMQDHATAWQAAVPELTKAQYAVMRAVAEHPGIEQARLGVAAATGKATLAELLGRLEKRGLLERTVDARDRRRRYVALTDQGAELLESWLPAVRRVDEAMLDAVSPAERADLIRLLRALLRDTQ